MPHIEEVPAPLDQHQSWGEEDAQPSLASIPPTLVGGTMQHEGSGSSEDLRGVTNKGWPILPGSDVQAIHCHLVGTG
eukprot:8599810-Lingulodinium_polyedra.AAC.1